MNISIIDTSDCISDIRSTVEIRRLTQLLFMSRWVVLATVVFGGLGVVLASPALDDWFLYGWYGALLVVSAFLWLITFRPKISIVNVPLPVLQGRFLIYVIGLALLWIVYDWYLGLFLQPSPEHLFIAMQVQTFYLVNCTFYFLSSRLISYGFIIPTMIAPISLFVTLFVMTSGQDPVGQGGFLSWADYYWLMALLQSLYLVLSLFSIRRMSFDLAGTVRLRTLYEISNSRLVQINKELESESNTDYLTGVANRRAYENGVQREWSRCLRNTSPFTLMVLDIDYFKLFNDRYGHLAGDKALKLVAEVFNDRLRRPGDLVARYGGEEFVAAITGTPMDDCRVLADKVRLSVRDIGLQHEDSPVDSLLTISIGIAQCIPNPKSSVRKLFAQADAALYHAKQEGRDQVIVFDDSLGHVLKEAEQERQRKSKQGARLNRPGDAGQSAQTTDNKAGADKPDTDTSPGDNEETTQPRPV